MYINRKLLKICITIKIPFCLPFYSHKENELDLKTDKYINLQEIILIMLYYNKYNKYIESNKNTLHILDQTSTLITYTITKWKTFDGKNRLIQQQNIKYENYAYIKTFLDLILNLDLYVNYSHNDERVLKKESRFSNPRKLVILSPSLNCIIFAFFLCLFG